MGFLWLLIVFGTWRNNGGKIERETVAACRPTSRNPRSLSCYAKGQLFFFACSLMFSSLFPFSMFFQEFDIAKVDYSCYSFTLVLWAAEFDDQNGEKKRIIQQMWSDVVEQIYVATTDRSHTCHVYELFYTRIPS